MRFSMRIAGSRPLGGGLALVVLGALLGLWAVQTHTPAGAAATPTWVTTQGKVVHLTLIAGYNGTNSGFNFDGAAHGQMTVTVPLGDKVIATFKNNAQGVQHNVVVIAYTRSLPASSSSPAFQGAASPTPQFGQGTAQTFSFVAGKAGRYLLVCGIAGHAIAGMWDNLVVSPTAKAASISFR